MSIGFTILKPRNWWRVSFDYPIDLSNWKFEVTPNKIVCRPTPIEFIYMIIGAILLLSLSIYLFMYLVVPLAKTWVKLNSHWIQPRPAQMQLFASAAMGSAKLPSQDRSKFQRDLPTMDEVRRANEELIESVTEDMTPEEREKFLSELAAKNVENKAQQNQPDSTLGKFLEIAMVVAWIAGVLLLTFLAMLGLSCLVRAIRFFHDRIGIRVVEQKLTIERAKTFGEMTTQQIPLSELGVIVCDSHIQRGRYHRSQTWNVQTSCRSNDLLPPCFCIEHCNSVTRNPTAKTKKFARALQAITRLPIAETS
jgi:hypothetical protein